MQQAMFWEVEVQVTGGRNPYASDVIEFTTIATKGNAVNFGNLITSVYEKWEQLNDFNSWLTV